jgi:hypothetical protein
MPSSCAGRGVQGLTGVKKFRRAGGHQPCCLLQSPHVDHARRLLLEVQRICSAQAPGQWRLVLPLDAPEAPSSVHAPDCLLCLPPLWLAPPAHAMVLAPASAAPAAPRREPWALAMVGALPQARAPLKCYKNNSYQRLMIGR